MAQDSINPAVGRRGIEAVQRSWTVAGIKVLPALAMTQQQE